MNDIDADLEQVMDDSEADGIAIVGIAGRFPGASDPRAFWRNIDGGVESISRFDPSELEDTFSLAVRANPDYVPARSIIENPEMFDAAFFGMLPREAALTDPQHRVFLECCWEALEDAGHDPATYPGMIGVFAGSTLNTYLLKHVCGDQAGIERFTSDYQVGSYQELIGALGDLLATRVCYKLDLRGPGVNVQSACSTSLLAISQACQSLMMYQADMVLAGGVSITFPQKRGYLATEGAMVSPEGRCRPFDAKASGTVFGSGAGVVVLKRLGDAISDGDHIYGVIRGFGINNDGSAKAGFTAPSTEGQAAVITQAHAMAGIEANQVGYVECHGTATPLGDPIEFAGLVKAFRETTDKEGFCVLGSGKANVGHLDAAAGVAGVIKAVMTLEHERIPPLLHYSSPNPHIDLTTSPFTINTEPLGWPRGSVPRMAGVSSFGVGGTNVHVVIEEGPDSAVRVSKRPAHLLTLSARSAAALDRMSSNLAAHLRGDCDVCLADVAWTLQRGRRRFAHRKTVVARDTATAIEALTGEALERVDQRSAPLDNPCVNFLFPGQGAQYIGMGAGVYATEPKFREVFDHCADILLPLIGLDLRSLLNADSAEAEQFQDRLKDTAIAQPAIFALEYSLATLWMSWGITPRAMVGHSIGEFAAATVAGVFVLDDVLAMVAARGRLMSDVAAGGMLSVRLSENEVLARLPPALSIAALNAPTVTVVAGPTAELAAFEAELTAAKIKTRQLVTSHAFHSTMMEPVVAAFGKVVEGVARHPPKIPLLSTLTGTWLTDEEAMDPGYWARHLRETVRFSTAIAQLRSDAGNVLLEVGPGNTLNTLARLHPGASGQVIASSLGGANAIEPEAETMAAALGALWLGGVEPDWPAVYGAEAGDRQRVPLPTYPFERKRHWRDAPASVARSVATEPCESFHHQTGIENMALDSKPVQATVELAARAQPKEQPRAERIRCALVDLFEELSGMDLGGTPRDATFLDIGFDSLFLTQATRELKNKLGIKVVFRQLLGDLGTLDALAAYADGRLPSDAFVKPVAVAEAGPAAAMAAVPVDAEGAVSQFVPGGSTGLPKAVGVAAQAVHGEAGSALERVMRDQLSVMSQLFSSQIGALQGGPASGVATSASDVVVAPPAVPMSALPAGSAPVTGVTSSAEMEKRNGAKDYQSFGPYKPLQTKRFGEMTPAQEAKIGEIVARYTKRTEKSKALTQAYRKPLADPRVVAGFRDKWKEMVYSVVTNKSKGSRLWDVDGNEYIDILNGFGPIMFGHRPEFIERAVESQLREGFEIGPQTPLAGEIAALFCELTGNDRMTFCNTGSEAVMAALRVARTVTGRDKVLTFAGDYHGMFDEVLIKPARSKDGAASAQPIAPGIPRDSVANMIVLDYGTPETLAWIRENAGELAAVLVEPIQSRRPDFMPVEFLKQVREITAKAGAALIFDEVVTGFRVHPGGAQAVFGIRADLATYGKVVGGGMPIGVLAGKCEYMDALDGGMWQFGDESVPEVGVTFFAGTFVRHPLTLAAVRAVLQEVKAQGPALQEELAAKTRRLVERLGAIFNRYGIPAKLGTSFSMMYFSFPPEETYATLFYYLLREHGVHVLEGFPCFMTSAHSQDDIDQIVAAFEKAACEMRSAGLFSGEMPASSLVSLGNLVDVARTVDQTRAVQAPGNTVSVPLTEPQREIFLATMLGDDVSIAFNESISTRLSGPLDLDALKTALNQVVARHDGLRGKLDADGTHLKITSELMIDPRFFDLSALPSDQRDGELERLLYDDAGTAFDLGNGPLMRAMIVRLGATMHVLVLSMHHIVCDGWSCNVIVEELGELYSAEIESRSSGLGRALSFAAFAGDKALQGDTSARAEIEAYWLDRFKEVPDLIELPTDRPRGNDRTYAGATLRHRMSRDTQLKLKQLGARHKASLFATLFAGLNALIMRVSGQSDLVIGVPMAGQSLVEGGSLVGHCVNFLPLRTKVDGGASFADLLGAAKDVVLDAYDHQDFTYGTLVQKLGKVRDPSRLPLTELQFNLEQLGSGAKFAGLKAHVDANAKAAVNSDIFFNVVERDDGLVVECDYNTDLYDAETISGWLAGLQLLLEGAAADASQSIAALPLPSGIVTKGTKKVAAPLSAADISQLAMWNDTTTAYPAGASIVTLFEDQAARTPNACAMTFGGRTMTYRELNENANRLAHHLISLGLRDEEMVACCMERSCELIVALIGILKAGGVYVPLDAGLPRERLAFMVADTRARFTVTNSALAAKGLSGLSTQPVLVDQDDEAIGAFSTDNPDLRSHAGSLAYVMYTSGSTGQPKGVMVEHRSVVRLVKNTNFCEFGPQSVLLQFAPVSFDASTLEIWGALLNGGRIAIMPPGEPSLVELGKVIREQGVTMAWLTAGLFHIMVEQRLEDLGGLKYLLAGGDVLSAAHVSQVTMRHPGVRMINGYGPTEGTTFTCCHAFEAGQAVADPVPIGKPISNTRIFVLDQDLKQVPVGAEGELFIAGDGLARGYLNNPDLTAQKFVTVNFGNGRNERLYRSGDQVRYLPDGAVQFLGRIDNQVKLRGYRIELGEIEVMLQRHPSVRQACVVAERENGRINRLVAFCSASEGSSVSEPELGEYLGARVPAYMVPAAIVSVDEFPLTTNGKVDRGELLEREKANRDGRLVVAPTTDNEALLTAIVKEVTRIDQIGVTDNLFELGIDSLKIFQITSRAAKAGLAVSPRAILQSRTIRAALVAAAAAPAAATAGPAIRPAVRQRVKLS